MTFSYLYLAIFLALIGACAIIRSLYLGADFGALWAGVGNFHQGLDAFYAYQRLVMAPPHSYFAFIFHTIRILHFAEHIVRAFNAVLAIGPAFGLVV